MLIFKVDIPSDSDLLKPSVTQNLRAVKVKGPSPLEPGGQRLESGSFLLYSTGRPNP